MMSMQLVFRTLSLVTLTMALAACEGPLVFMSGGELSGTVADPPPIWQLDEASGIAQLETRPEDPYSINLAYVQSDGRLYIYAGNTRTNWVGHIEQNPQIRIRVGETIYPVHALRVDDNEEIAEFAVQWSNRSMLQRDPMQFDEIWLYRLEAHQPSINN
jgi:hypothetical protein